MKQLLSTYSISGNVVTLTGVNRPREAVLSITNSTTGAILYTAQTGGATDYTQGTNSTITLATAPGSSDRLQIFYDDGVAPANAPSTVAVSGTVPVSASSLPLPTGAAIESGNLATIATEAVAIDNKLPSLSSGRVPVEANNAASQSYSFTQTGAVAANTVLIGPIDCGQFREITLSIVALGSGMQVVGQFSPDGTNWGAAVSQRLSDGTTNSNQLSGIQKVSYPAFEKFFRVINNTAQTSGTTTLVAYASQQATPKLYQQVSGSVSLSGSQVITPVPLGTTGFASYHSLISAASTNATTVRASGGTIGTCVLSNTSASWRYVKFFNATSVTLGTSTPVIQFPVAPNSTLDVSTSFAGLRLTLGIIYAITSGPALLDTGAVGAGDVLVNLTFV